MNDLFNSGKIFAQYSASRQVAVGILRSSN